MASKKQREWAKRMMPYAEEASRRTGVPASAILAQAALESRYGQSAPGNMYFGIKAGKSWTGPVQYLRTKEEINGKMVTVREPFRAYETPLDSFTDWANLIKNNPRYAAVMTSKTPQEAFQALAAAGYATDSKYASKLNSVYRNLTGDMTPLGDVPDTSLAGTYGTLKQTKRPVVDERVRFLQQTLNQNFGFDLKEDGIFGPDTEVAVKAYQKTVGVEPDGIVGPRTWGSIQATAFSQVRPADNFAPPHIGAPAAPPQTSVNSMVSAVRGPAIRPAPTDPTMAAISRALAPGGMVRPSPVTAAAPRPQASSVSMNDMVSAVGAPRRPSPLDAIQRATAPGALDRAGAMAPSPGPDMQQRLADAQRQLASITRPRPSAPISDMVRQAGETAVGYRSMGIDPAKYGPAQKNANAIALAAGRRAINQQGQEIAAARAQPAPAPQRPTIGNPAGVDMGARSRLPDPVRQNIMETAAARAAAARPQPAMASRPAAPAAPRPAVSASDLARRAGAAAMAARPSAPTPRPNPTSVSASSVRPGSAPTPRPSPVSPSSGTRALTAPLPRPKPTTVARPTPAAPQPTREQAFATRDQDAFLGPSTTAPRPAAPAPAAPRPATPAAAAQAAAARPTGTGTGTAARPPSSSTATRTSRSSSGPSSSSSSSSPSTGGSKGMRGVGGTGSRKKKTSERSRSAM